MAFGGQAQIFGVMQHDRIWWDRYCRSHRAKDPERVAPASPGRRFCEARSRER
jgi:hypothetical protein